MGVGENRIEKETASPGLGDKAGCFLRVAPQCRTSLWGKLGHSAEGA